MTVVCMGALLGGCAATSEGPETSAPPVAGYRQKTLGDIPAFAFENRRRIFETMNGLARKLYGSAYYKTLQQKKMDTFEASYPILELIDRDADGVADEFACLPEINSPDTLEFGVIFDLDGEKPWGAETQFDSGNVGNMILSDIV